MKKIIVLMIFMGLYGYAQQQQEPEYVEKTITTLYGSATLQMALILGNEEITKPFIIAEGFDPGAITNPEKALGDTDMRSFDNSLVFSGSNLRNKIDVDFDSQSYDIIYINWNNGVADIRNNSKVLEAVLNWVNTEKDGDEPNVLLGQSMGGLVGRYTLARMEQEDANFDPTDPATSPHQVRLFIAHDSPLQGSNTPISAQHFSRHMYNLYVGTPVAYAIGEEVMPIVMPIAEQISNWINAFGANTTVDPYVTPETSFTIQDSPAAMQMNYWWVNYDEEATTAYHDNWQQVFDAMGYPEGCRNIAISNGSDCPSDHGFEPGDMLLEIDDLDNPDFFGDLVHMIATSLGGSITGNLPLEILGGLPGSSKWHYNFELRATPDTAGEEVYFGKVTYKKKLFWLVETTLTLTQRNINAPTGILPHGYYSGGEFNFDNVLGSLPDQMPPVIVHHESYGFIPVVSALDIKRYSGPVDTADYLRSYSGGTTHQSGLTSPFDNFVVGDTPGTNYDHISFQFQNGEWLSDELDGFSAVVPDCSFICNDSEIKGIDSFCSGNHSYSVPTGAANYNWSISSNSATIVSGANTASVTIADGLYSGWVTLTADVTGNSQCLNGTVLSLSKDVYIGKPTFSTITEVSPSVTRLRDPIASADSCDDYGFYLEVAPSNDDLLEVEYSKGSGSYQWSHSNTAYLIITPTCNETIDFDVRFRNSCGWTDWQTITYTFTDCGNCSSGSSGDEIESNDFLIYPVPADSSLTVKLKNELPGLLQNGDSLNIKLYYATGLMAQNINAIATQTTLNVANLPLGVYSLVLNYNGVIETHQIAIE